MNVPQILTDFVTSIGSSLGSIIQAIVTALVVVISYLMTPLVLLIQGFLPNLSGVLSSIAIWVGDIQTYLSYVVDALGIPPIVLQLVSAWIVFRLSISLYWWFLQTAFFRWFKK